MVAAVNDDGEAVSSNPFCKMYDGLADADETTVDEYFMKRYAIVENDFAHPAVMSLMDMSLMADTEYSYRLRAVYQVGVSDWSETAMATAVQVPPSTELTAPSAVMATVGVTDPGAITVTWTPGENATGGHLVLLFNSDFTEVPHVETPTEEGMYTIPDVTMPGDYVVVVVSIKSRSEYLYDYARVNVP